MKFVTDLNEGQIQKIPRGSLVAGAPGKRIMIITKFGMKKQRTILRVKMSAKQA